MSKTKEKEKNTKKTRKNQGEPRNRSEKTIEILRKIKKHQENQETSRKPKKKKLTYHLPHATYHLQEFREGSPCHTANMSMSAHKWAGLGFNITQLLTKVTNLEITRSCTKVQAGKNITHKFSFFSSVLRSGWDCNSQTEVHLGSSIIYKFSISYFAHL